MIKNFDTNYKELLKGVVVGNDGVTKADIISSQLLVDPYKALTKFEAIPNGNPIVRNSQTIYVGRAVLTNNTDTEQRLKSDSFSYTETFTTSSQVTHGFNLGVNTTVAFEFNVLLAGIKANVSVSTNYNFSKTNIESKAVSKTIAIPSQDIVVPPHSSVEVIGYFNKGVAQGTTTLKATFSGWDKDIRFKDQNGTLREVGYALGAIPIFASKSVNVKELGFDYKNEDLYTLYAVGSGTYSTDIATEYRVAVTPIVNGKKVGETKIIDVDPVITIH